MANEFKVKNGLILQSGSLTLPGTLVANSSAGTNGQYLQSTGTGLQWATVTTATALSQLTDATITSVATNQLLAYNGSKWVNTATITSTTASNLTLTGTLTANSSAGTNGQFLKSTGTGVVWATPSGSSLATLSDVSITTPTSSQVLTYNGTTWVNSTPNQQVASAVFSASVYDMGYVYDSNVTVTEDEGLVTGANTYVYDLGILSFSGIISLSNLDQSVKSDYLGYSIIFGF
jgi:hypothetical protein